MPRILRSMPFFSEPTAISFTTHPAISIAPDQIIVWVSLARRDVNALAPGVARIPAVLDTGFNNTFLIQEQHLRDWCSLSANRLPRTGRMRVGGATLPMHDADVWLYPNIPGKRDEFSEESPFRLALDCGLGVWPTGVPGARRLPLLGMRALRLAGLQLNIDFLKCRVSLRTARRWWWF